MKSKFARLLLLFVLMGATAALAGTDSTTLDISLSKKGNGKNVSVEVKAGHSNKYMQMLYDIELHQTGPIRFMMQPNGEMIVPLWLEIVPMDYLFGQGDVPLSQAGATVNLMDASTMAGKDSLCLLVDLKQVDGMIYHVYIPSGFDKDHRIQISYDGRTKGAANSLKADMPDFKGIRVNEEESRGNYVVLELEKGVPIPYPSKWTFYSSWFDDATRERVEARVEIDAVEGYFSKDGNGRYLPPVDKQILAQYPELKNKCILTFTHFDSKGNSNYVVVEGRWPAE